MPVRRILQLGDPLLRQPSAPLARFEEALPVLDDLKATLADFRHRRGFGRGISAIQIGQPLRLIYIEFQGEPLALLNPEYEWRSEETFELWDDCFCFPDLLVKLDRSVSVRLNYQDAQGVSRTLQASGALAELIQHEMDHLDGILAIDRAKDKFSFCTREEYERRYRNPARQAVAG